MSAVTMLSQLNNAELRKLDPETWGPAGTIRVIRCEESDTIILLELRIPTDRHDYDDFIWVSELANRTTEKFVLLQSGGPIYGGVITNITRVGDKSSTEPDANAYVVEFQLPAGSVSATEFVVLRCRDHAGRTVSETC